MKFLVISYCDEEEQWFYDHVSAPDADSARHMVLSTRTYCSDADAIGDTELWEMLLWLSCKSEEEVRFAWLRLRLQIIHEAGDD